MLTNNKLYPVYFVGTLISEERLAKLDVENRGFRPVYKVNNQLQFLVEPISSLPDSFPEIKYFHAFASQLEKKNQFDEFSYDHREREEELQKFLRQRILIFKAFRNGQYYNIETESLKILKAPLEYTPDTKYMVIPIFKQGDGITNKEEFERRIIQRRFLGSEISISTDENDVPQVIAWDDGETDAVTLYGVFDEFKHTSVGGFRFEYTDNIKFIEFDDVWEDSSLLCSDISLIFTSVTTYMNIVEKIKVQGETLCSDIKNDEMVCVNDTVVNEEQVAILEQDLSENDDEEKQFIQYFIKKTQQDGFVYDTKDLVNFHISMKASNLVILAGMSGTGKSKLISLYGKSMGLSDEQIKIIPVRPSWTDDSDLLGYLDTLNMLYRPADTGLVETLIAAQNKDNLYIVCFDEMNLSRVEHYFSQFLSVLEKDNVHEKRYLQLYNSELENRVYNSNQYRSKIELGDNILFVGTVNLDESTYHFSDKVLDRANVINLKVCPMEFLKKLDETRKENSRPNNEKPVKISFRDFNEFKQKQVFLELNEREIAFLTELHNVMHCENKNLGIGYRIVRQIDAYTKNIPNGDWITRKECFDLQVIQRILTKLRGPEDQLQGLLGKIKENTGDYMGGKIQAIVDRYKDVSDFAETEKIIRHKAKELKMYGYTI